MIVETRSRSRVGKLGTALAIACVVVVVIAVDFAPCMRRFVRESRMLSVTSAHYEILCPAGTLSQDSMTEFATQREPLFLSLERKLNDVASIIKIRLIFDTDFKARDAATGTARPYEVTRTTVRTALSGRATDLDPSADAEALLNIAWGEPGNPLIARWTARWLVGEWKGQELGMAAAEVEQNLGHKKVAILLGQPSDVSNSPEDRDLLGAAWVNSIAELGGHDIVRKLYSTKISKLDEAGVAKTLGTTPAELERKWQMWIYAYVAGMPPVNHPMTMPMDMATSK